MSSKLLTDSGVSDDIVVHIEASSDAKCACEAACAVLGTSTSQKSLNMKVIAETGIGDCESLCDAISCNGMDEPASPVSFSNPDELALLEKLDRANRMLEADSRSLQSLGSHSQRRMSPGSGDHLTADGLSRRDSMSSILSATSVCSTSNSMHCEDYTQENLWSLWGSIVSDWENVVKKRASHLKELVRRGIPHHFRGIVWQLLCGVDQTCPDKKIYSDYLKMTSPFEKTIGRDITRTFPGHELFKEKDGVGQESLFNVMKAYSLHDREVGYCQGSAFIVGLLLMQMPEEEAFAVLVKIMHVYNLRELFKPSMAELGLRMYQLEVMIRDQIPELYNHFQVQGIATSMFASSWFLTLFTTTLPLSLACRVFDIFLLEGIEAIFRVGIAILLLNMDDLLTLDMEEMIKFLQKDLAVKLESDPEVLLTTAFQVKYSPRRLKRVEKEYAAMKTKELEEQVELRRLRTENKLLQQRISNLEKETETLADRLIQDQVKCAQQDEQICILRQRLAAAKRDGAAASDLPPLPDLSSISTTSSTQPDSIASSIMSKMTSLANPLFGPKDKSRRVEQLQRELDDACVALQRLKERLTQVENENRSLTANKENQAASPADLQELHNELIACKLREAEANMGLKQLQNDFYEIERLWQKSRDRTSETISSQSQMQQLNDSLMAGRLREADLLCRLTDTKQNLLLVEQQSAANDRRARLVTAENDELRHQKETLEREKSDCQSLLESTVAELQMKHKEELMLAKLRDAEHLQLVTEMRRRIAELEIQNEDLSRENKQLQQRSVNLDSDDTDVGSNDLRLEADGSSIAASDNISSTSTSANATASGSTTAAHRGGLSLQFRYNSSVLSSHSIDLTPTNDVLNSIDPQSGNCPAASVCPATGWQN